MAAAAPFPIQATRRKAMGLFSKGPSKAEVRGFARGKQSSAKAAEAYARQQRDKAATRKAVAERKAAARRGKR